MASNRSINIIIKHDDNEGFIKYTSGWLTDKAIKELTLNNTDE